MAHVNRLVDYLIIGDLIVLMASASSYLGLNFHIICIGVLVLLSVIRGVKIGAELFWLSLFWLGINLIAFYFTGTNQNLNAILGPLLLIYIPYYALKVIGEKFWFHFEKVVFILVVIDMILYAISNLYPSFFISLYPYFRPWTNDALYDYSAGEGEYWYSYIFTFNAKYIYRNNGFMWEPGAYGLLLVLMLLYRWSINGKKIGKHEFVYIISIITTLSTASFLALAVLFIWYILSIRNVIYKVLLIPIFIYTCIWVSNLSFMGDKINDFVSETKIYDYGSVEGHLEANRILSFYIALEQIRHLPTGYGSTSRSTFTPELASVSMVNGIGDLLTKWGVIGLFLILYLIHRFWQASYKSRYAYFATISYITLLFSNPISNNPILWIVVWSSLIYGQTITEERISRIKDRKSSMIIH